MWAGQRCHMEGTRMLLPQGNVPREGWRLAPGSDTAQQRCQEGGGFSFCVPASSGGCSCLSFLFSCSSSSTLWSCSCKAGSLDAALCCCCWASCREGQKHHMKQGGKSFWKGTEESNSVSKNNLIHAEIIMEAQHGVSRAGHPQTGCWPPAKKWKNSRYNNKHTNLQSLYRYTMDWLNDYSISSPEKHLFWPTSPFTPARHVHGQEESFLCTAQTF